jgi:hypothetical protein
LNFKSRNGFKEKRKAFGMLLRITIGEEDLPLWSKFDSQRLQKELYISFVLTYPLQKKDFKFPSALQRPPEMKSYVTHEAYEGTTIIEFRKQTHLPIQCDVKV